MLNKFSKKVKRSIGIASLTFFLCSSLSFIHIKWTEAAPPPPPPNQTEKKPPPPKKKPAPRPNVNKPKPQAHKPAPRPNVNRPKPQAHKPAPRPNVNKPKPQAHKPAPRPNVNKPKPQAPKPTPRPNVNRPKPQTHKPTPRPNVNKPKPQTHKPASQPNVNRPKSQVHKPNNNFKPPMIKPGKKPDVNTGKKPGHNLGKNNIKPPKIKPPIIKPGHNSGKDDFKPPMIKPKKDKVPRKPLKKFTVVSPTPVVLTSREVPPPPSDYEYEEDKPSVWERILTGIFFERMSFAKDNATLTSELNDMGFECAGLDLDYPEKYVQVYCNNYNDVEDTHIDYYLDKSSLKVLNYNPPNYTIRVNEYSTDTTKPMDRELNTWEFKYNIDTHTVVFTNLYGNYHSKYKNSNRMDTYTVEPDIMAMAEMTFYMAYNTRFLNNQSDSFYDVETL